MDGVKRGQHFVVTVTQPPGCVFVSEGLMPLIIINKY